MAFLQDWQRCGSRPFQTHHLLVMTKSYHATRRRACARDLRVCVRFSVDQGLAFSLSCMCVVWDWVVLGA